MERTIAEQKEHYIEQTVQIELGGIEEPAEDERLERVQFWQGRSGHDRFCATVEIANRVQLARGESIADLRVDRSITNLVRKS